MRLVATVMLGILVTAEWSLAACPELTSFDRFRHAEIGEIELFRSRDDAARVVAFTSQMHVNTDGAPDSYHPDNTGITHICNGVSVGAAGQPCTWKPDCLGDFQAARARSFEGDPRICFFAMVAPGGKPVVQGRGDPKPGFYVSTTALKHVGKDRNRTEGQLDSNEVPFVVLPSSWNGRFQGMQLGDVAAVFRRSRDMLEFAVVGDLGPVNKLGEGSVALHRALGNDPFIVRNGVRRALRGIGGRDVFYVIFPGSRSAMPDFSPATIRAKGQELLTGFGGESKLKECALP